MNFGSIESQLTSTYQQQQQQQQALLDQQKSLQQQSAAYAQATIASGQQLTETEKQQLQAQQAIEAERLHQVTSSRRNGLLILAGIGLVASVGIVVLMGKNSH
jgi:hypothetical protein